VSSEAVRETALMTRTILTADTDVKCENGGGEKAR
jgi:hypothetical protein